MSANPTYEKLKQRVKELEKNVVDIGQRDDSMQLLSSAIAQSSEGIAIVDLDGKLEYLNDAFATMHEYSVKELIGKNLSIFHTPQQMPPVEAANTQLKKTGRFKGEIWRVTRNGTEFPALMHNSLLRNDMGNPMGILMILTDITDLKGKGANIKASELRFRELFNYISSGVAVYEAKDNGNDFIFIDVNRAGERIENIKKENLLGKSVLEIFPKVKEFGLFEVFKRVWETGRPEHHPTCLYKNNRIIGWRKNYVYKLPFGEIVSVYDDTTERKQSEEVLLKNEGKYREIFENIQDVYYETTIDGTILEISPSIENISHYKRKELIGKSSYDIYTHSEQRNELISMLLTKGKAHDFEIFLTDKDGSQHPCTINVVLIKDEQGNPIKFVGSLRDISKRKQLEAQLRHAQKMESIGTLAGGIAHEFNNILGIILGNAELAVDDVPESSLAKECLDEIRSASLRASDVVQQMLSFARKNLIEREPVNLTPIIKDCLRLLRSSIPATIEISQDISCEVDTVFADPTQMRQVLMNLCTNAAQAMDEHGGVLEVTLKNIEFEKQDEELEIKSGCYAALTVSDTGHGIKPEIIEQIFDPYFTTKEVGTGTGMGLSVVHGIVKSCHGVITVQSEPGKGSIFQVLLPVFESETQQKSGEPEALPTGNEKILFIDDEESIVKMVKRILERLGYQVETKTNPAEALELFRSGPDRFDLVITDMTMPKIAGEKLVKEILNIRANMPIILCTGYHEKISEEKAGELGVKALVLKPFVVRDFTLTVRKVLD